jgi:hypothetical protein
MKLPKSVAYALIAFMAAWQATEFNLDYRAIMGSLVAGAMGYLNPSRSADASAEEIVES